MNPDTQRYYKMAEDYGHSQPHFNDEGLCTCNCVMCSEDVAQSPAHLVKSTCICLECEPHVQVAPVVASAQGED